MRITLLLALIALAGARSIQKRNSYGDEPVVPSVPTETVVEETPEEVPEPAPAPAEHVEEVPQQESGYRSKRGAQNGYGDEPVAPVAEETQHEQVEEAPEQVPEPAPAPAEHVEEVPQEESGYRSKRGAQNGYGDEPVAPAAEETQPEQVEEATEETPEEVPEAAPAPVEHVEEVPQQDSGYRSKRGAQNGYGDEPVAPAAEETQPEQVEEVPEQVPEQVPEPAPAPVEHVEEVPQQESGYRSKRAAQNGYGDEPVAPAAEEYKPQPAEETPEEVPEEAPEQAPAPAETVEEVPQQESGYRSKRGAQNGYGDEPVAPTVEETQPEEVEEATEETPEEVPEPAPAPVEHVEEVPQQESGYRSKRAAQNGYGDEPVAPVAEETQPEQVEETPEEVPEPAPAPAEHVEEVPQQESGYRSKRAAQNGYGDEPVAPVAEETQHEQVEEAPEQVPEPAPAPAEHVEEVPQQESGYRSKRGAQNGYGDEPVAPAVEESQPVENTPEEVPEAAPAPAEHVEAVPQEESGYRA